mmetsp:Transcript_47842/g.119689  ORF Transcript_47842/g.119689 Transcript_47842/m.119689 type:complete len:160 (+) Transcript_47842:365-844(+)
MGLCTLHCGCASHRRNTHTLPATFSKKFEKAAHVCAMTPSPQASCGAVPFVLLRPFFWLAQRALDVHGTSRQLLDAVDAYHNDLAARVRRYQQTSFVIEKCVDGSHLVLPHGHIRAVLEDDLGFASRHAVLHGYVQDIETNGLLSIPGAMSRHEDVSEH